MARALSSTDLQRRILSSRRRFVVGAELGPVSCDGTRHGVSTDGLGAVGAPGSGGSAFRYRRGGTNRRRRGGWGDGRTARGRARRRVGAALHDYQELEFEATRELVRDNLI